MLFLCFEVQSLRVLLKLSFIVCILITLWGGKWCLGGKQGSQEFYKCWVNFRTFSLLIFVILINRVVQVHWKKQGKCGKMESTHFHNHSYWLGIFFHVWGRKQTGKISSEPDLFLFFSQLERVGNLYYQKNLNETSNKP